MLVDSAMALVEPLYLSAMLPGKQEEEKATFTLGNSTLEAPLGLTHQDCNHNADVLGILPEYVAKGDFCKMCQAAKEHQKAQHFNQRSDLQREKGPKSGHPRAALAFFAQMRMCRLGYRLSVNRQSQCKSFSSGFCCWLFYRLTYLALSNSFRLPFVKFLPQAC